LSTLFKIMLLSMHSSKDIWLKMNKAFIILLLSINLFNSNAEWTQKDYNPTMLICDQQCYTTTSNTRNSMYYYCCWFKIFQIVHKDGQPIYDRMVRQYPLLPRFTLFPQSELLSALIDCNKATICKGLTKENKVYSDLVCMATDPRTQNIYQP